MTLDVERKHSAGALVDRYVARDRASGKSVLVSVVRPTLPDINETRQARVLEAVRRYKGLVHPHLCPQIGVGFTSSDQMWLAQELPEEGEQQERGEGKAERSLEQGAETLTHICEGLAYVHARELVHGAFTSDCILFDRTQRPKIVDFGIAAALYEAGILHEHTRANGWIAPEVAAGDEPTPASDVYALGALGVRLLCPDEEDGSSLSREALVEKAHKIPVGGLAAAIERALQPDPQARFSSAEEMLRQLRAVVVPAGRRQVARKARPSRIESAAPAEPEMGHLKAVGLILWTTLRSLLALTLGLALIIAAVAGGLVLALRSTPPLVIVPAVEGKPVAQAASLASAQGLKPKVSRREYNKEVPIDHVIRQAPYAGKTVRAGRALELVVSLGPPEVKVPKLAGLSVSEAKEKLIEAGLRLGAISRRRAAAKPDRILEQTPAPGTDVAVGSEVNVTVAVPKTPPRQRQRDRGPRAGDVTIIVPAGPVVQRVRVEVHYPNGRYTVAYNRTHRPGDKVKVHVAAEGEASVHVLIDGELVAEQDLEPSP